MIEPSSVSSALTDLTALQHRVQQQQSQVNPLNEGAGDRVSLLLNDVVINNPRTQGISQEQNLFRYRFHPQVNNEPRSLFIDQKNIHQQPTSTDRSLQVNQADSTQPKLESS